MQVYTVSLNYLKGDAKALKTVLNFFFLMNKPHITVVEGEVVTLEW